MQSIMLAQAAAETIRWSGLLGFVCDMLLAQHMQRCLSTCHPSPAEHRAGDAFGFHQLPPSLVDECVSAATQQHARLH